MGLGFWVLELLFKGNLGAFRVPLKGKPRGLGLLGVRGLKFRGLGFRVFRV